MTTPTEIEPTPKAGRPRSAEAHQAILSATLELLATMGFQALSIEQVAARAGVGKQTIYRRWPAKEALVIEAIRSIQSEMPVKDSGNLRDDLIAMYQTALHSLQTIPLIKALYLRLIGEYFSNPLVFQTFLEQIILPRLDQFVQMAAKAQARGEIRQNLDLRLVTELLIGPMLFRWLTTDVLVLPSASAAPESTIEPLVDLVLRCLQDPAT